MSNVQENDQIACLNVATPLYFLSRENTFKVMERSGKEETNDYLTKNLLINEVPTELTI